VALLLSMVSCLNFQKWHFAILSFLVIYSIYSNLHHTKCLKIFNSNQKTTSSLSLCRSVQFYFKGYRWVSMSIRQSVSVYQAVSVCLPLIQCFVYHWSNVCLPLIQPACFIHLCGCNWTILVSLLDSLQDVSIAPYCHRTQRNNYKKWINKSAF